MPELSQGKQFLYRLIVSQLQQDGFVNVATSLSIATIGQTKIIPSDRLNNLISLCAQVVRDTDAEAEEKDINGPVVLSNSSQKEMGAQQSAFHPALSDLLQNQAENKEQEGDKPLSEKSNQMSQAALKSLHQLQMLKVFSNMTEATRQAYLQSQALQKKPFYLNPPVNTFNKDIPTSCYGNTKDPIRPFPLSTPDIKTPQCRSTLLPFTSSGNHGNSSSSNHGNSTQDSASSFSFNGNHDLEIKVENARNIHAMEEIIKLTDEQPSVTMATGLSKALAGPISSTGVSTSCLSSTGSSLSNALPLPFLHDHADTAIQELLMQRQLKQRRFKDLDCSFVSQLIQPKLSSMQDHKPKIDFSAVMSRLSGVGEDKRGITSPPSLSAGSLVDGLLASAVGAGTSASTDQARYECPRCARVFAYEYVLQTHMRQVCPDRSNYKHPCTVCKKRFQNQSSLKRHMIVHTGERKYECEVCHKRFGRSHHLKRHVKIHEMEAANYSQHHPSEGIPEETLQLILQLGAMHKFPLSPASLIDTAITEDMMSNDCDSIDDGESLQGGDIDMEDHSSDIGESGCDPEESIFSSGSGLLSGNSLFSANALSIQNIINSNASLFYNSSEMKKPVVTLPPLSSAALSSGALSGAALSSAALSGVNFSASLATTLASSMLPSNPRSLLPSNPLLPNFSSKAISSSLLPPPSVTLATQHTPVTLATQHTPVTLATQHTPVTLATHTPVTMATNDTLLTTPRTDPVVTLTTQPSTAHEIQVTGDESTHVTMATHVTMTPSTPSAI